GIHRSVDDPESVISLSSTTAVRLAHICYREMLRYGLIVLSGDLVMHFSSVWTVLLGNCAVVQRPKRQTYKYDEALLAYAHPHPNTVVKQGYLARYAPQDWPKW
ncbi:hypothetical protein GCK32_021748, partial [Trichostrongylus colubriformis]